MAPISKRLCILSGVICSLLAVYFVWSLYLNPTEDAAKHVLRRLGQRDAPACPSWFGNIKTDLSPWSSRGGISLQILESGIAKADVRIQIVDGELYIVEHEGWATPHRRLASLWGLLMLVRRFGRAIPNVDFLMRYGDRPSIPKPAADARGNGSAPPVIFEYCSDRDHVSVVWPDWTFWGHIPLEIPPWTVEEERIAKVVLNPAKEWSARIPRAFWKGNMYSPGPSPTGIARQCIVKRCTTPPKYEWNVEAYTVDWGNVNRSSTRLEDECNHRYMIHVQGNAWSVSLKYQMACRAPMIVLTPYWYDFFSRALVPGKHFVPLDLSVVGLCERLNETVHMFEEKPSLGADMVSNLDDFVRNELSMSIVYSYMNHLLREYAALLNFTVERSPTARHIREKDLLLFQSPLAQEYLLESLPIKDSEDQNLCTWNDQNNRVDLKWNKISRNAHPVFLLFLLMLFLAIILKQSEACGL